MNVGEYVRTKDGYIGKITKIEQNERIHYMQKSIYTDNWKDLNMVLEETIIKSSPQIIDLVEYMDMLYLKKPIKIYGINKTIKLFNPVRCDGFTTYDDGTHCIILDLGFIVDVNDLEIEAVITHEQMEAMQYRVEE